MYMVKGRKSIKTENMKQKCKKSTQSLLASLRGRQTDNHNISSQDLDQQDDHVVNENMITPTLSDGNLISSSNSNEASSKVKEKSLLVKIKDFTTQKMQIDRVWNLEKNRKAMVELNGDGQGSDNGSNLLVRFFGRISQKSVFCPISIVRWDRMPKEKKQVMWELIEEHFEFDYEVGVDWVMQSLRDRWRSFKYKLRNDNFYPNKIKEELLEKSPKNVDSVVDWTAFVNYYNEEKTKKQYAQNAKNRKKLTVSHADGSKSNAMRGLQMEQKLGRPVCQSEVILSTLL